MPHRFQYSRIVEVNHAGEAAPQIVLIRAEAAVRKGSDQGRC